MGTTRPKALTPEARREYLAQVGPRYRRAGERTVKHRILDEFCAVCGYERKYAIKLLGRRRGPPSRAARRGAPARYGAAHMGVVKPIWLAAEQPCGKRLAALLPQWLPFYEGIHGELAPELRAQVLAMSPATLDRLLAPLRAAAGAGRRRPTAPGTLLRTQIPIRTRWDEAQGQPGWIEADTVAHCGGSMAGDFVWSLTLTDIASGWTELAAVWNRGSQGVVSAVDAIAQRLVFPILGFDCDNGSEFLNQHLQRYFAQQRPGLKWTRSRPYMSNDNAHVEQKQWTHVRQLLGYDRLDDARLVEPIERIYRPWALLHNFFLPSVKLAARWREGARVKRRHDPPTTPCDRLLACPALDEEAKEQLRRIREQLDPFELHRQIEAALGPLHRWMRARRALTPGTLPPDPRSFAPEGPAAVKNNGQNKGPDPSRPSPPACAARSPA